MVWSELFAYLWKGDSGTDQGGYQKAGRVNPHVHGHHSSWDQ